MEVELTIGGGTGEGGARPPTFSLQGPCCFSPPQLEPKIKQLQHIHKPHYILHAQTILDGSPQFDVSFPGQLLKIVATRGEIFSLKFTKYSLVAGFRPDPLGELKRSLRPQ